MESAEAVSELAGVGVQASPATPRLWLSRWEIAVVASLVAALILRFADISGPGYWHDEIFTVDLVRLPFVRMFHGIVRTEGTPPAYYVVAWLWSRVFGTNEAGLRSLSALASALTLLPVYVAGRLLFRPRVGVAAAALAATSPLLVWYGQEARSYALGILGVATSLAATAVAVRYGLSARTVGFWATVSIWALLTHYFTVFAVAAEASWLWWLSRNGGRRTLVVGSSAVAAGGGCLIPLVLAQRGNPAWIATSNLVRRILEVPSELLAGPQPSVGLYAVPVLVLCLAAVAIAWRRDRTLRTRAAATLAIGGAVVLVPLALVAVGVDFFVARNVVFASPFFFVAVAACVASSRGGVAIVTAIVVLNLYIVATTLGQPKYGREDWRSAAAALGEPRGSGVVVLTPSEGENVFSYYRPLARVLRGATARVEEVDIVGLPPAEHRIGQDPVPPRPVSTPHLPGFNRVRRILGTDYTIIQLRSDRPTVVSERQLLALGLDGTPALLFERSR